MKKILISFLLTATATLASAKETITIMYAFSPSDTTGNYSRVIANELNASQDKYTFVFDAKPGAGGTLAVNDVLSKPNNTILHHSTAFFVRPVIFPKESWDIGAFKEQFVYCAAPLVVAGGTVKSWKEVANKKDVTIGISGLGVTTHLMAVQLQKKYPNLIIVPFKSTTDAVASMFARQTDLAIGFPGEVSQWAAGGKVSVLGITGAKSHKGFPSLTSQGFDKIYDGMVVGQHLAVPKSWSDEKTKEIYDMLNRVANRQAVLDSYKDDLCVPKRLPYTGLNGWFDSQTEYWKQLSSEVKIN
jgi:tripartite-type tricarboxylate transporter receptor subunit TctC